MTNGEKLKQVFPNIQIDIGEIYIYVWIDHEPAHITKEWWNEEYKEPTTPNDCETCIHNKGVLECDMYGCKYEPTTKNDSPKYCDHNICLKNEYNNIGCDECEVTKSQVPTTKNDLGVDCIDRNYATRLLADIYHNSISDSSLKIYQIINWLNQLPSVTPQEPCDKCEVTFKDDNAVSRLSVRDIIYANAYELEYPDASSEYVVNRDELIKYLMELPSVTPQEPILDKIREQIKSYLRGVEITLEVLVENDPLRPKMEGAKDTLEECLNLIDNADRSEEQIGENT